MNVMVLLIMAQNAFAQVKDLHFQWIENYEVPDARRTLKMPQIEGYKTLTADFHMHTYFSDGEVTPKTRVIEAWREGLDIIAISDHSTPVPKHLDADHNTSYEMAKSTAKKRNMILIPATEYTQREPYGHYNFLFIKDANPYAATEAELHPGKAIENAAGEGAFVILNHPGWPDRNSDLDPFHTDLMKRGKIHAIEVLNSFEFYPIAIDHANQHKLTMISASDIHSAIGEAYDLTRNIRNHTIIFAKDQSETAIKEALMEGRTIAYAKNTLVGDPKWLLPFFVNSFEVSQLKIDGTRFSCELTNHSDINWVLYGPEFRRLVLPANRTIILNDNLTNADLVFEVMNTWINSTEHLSLPLSILLDEKDQVAAPFVPQELLRIDLHTPIKIVSPTPGSQVFYTLDGSEPTMQSIKYEEPIVPATSSVLKIRSFKDGMSPSRIISKNILLNILHPSKKIKPGKKGVRYTFYEGQFLSVHEFESHGKKLGEGIFAQPTILESPVKDHFGYTFRGYLQVPVSGEYIFSLATDDGSALTIDGVTLIDNDGSHSLKKVGGRMQLEKGFHSFELRYFDDYAEEEMKLFWTIPGKTESIISADHFFTGE